MSTTHESERVPEIINRGRGPEIAGTRITVYDILDYTEQGWHPRAIADWLQLSSAQVLVAIGYIDEHRGEVMATYRQILERSARGNPPEVQAKLDAIDAKYKVLWADRLRKAGITESNGAGHPGGQ